MFHLFRVIAGWLFASPIGIAFAFAAIPAIKKYSQWAVIIGIVLIVAAIVLFAISFPMQIYSQNKERNNLNTQIADATAESESLKTKVSSLTSELKEAQRSIEIWRDKFHHLDVIYQVLKSSQTSTIEKQSARIEKLVADDLNNVSVEQNVGVQSDQTSVATTAKTDQFADDSDVIK